MFSVMKDRTAGVLEEMLETGAAGSVWVRRGLHQHPAVLVLDGVVERVPAVARHIEEVLHGLRAQRQTPLGLQYFTVQHQVGAHANAHKDSAEPYCFHWRFVTCKEHMRMVHTY